MLIRLETLLRVTPLERPRETRGTAWEALELSSGHIGRAWEPEGTEEGGRRREEEGERGIVVLVVVAVVVAMKRT